MDDLPAVLGCDGSGIIEAVGAEVSKFQVGDKVYFFHGGIGPIQGNYAEFKTVEERFVALDWADTTMKKVNFITN